MANTEWNAGQLLELSGGYWKTCTLHTAVKLDIFTLLAKGPMEAGAVAAAAQTDPRATEMLLNALCAMELVQLSEQGYAGRPEVVDLLDKHAPGYIGHMILHHSNLVPSWSQLATAVTTGRPVRDGSTTDDDQWRENFLMGMYTLARTIAPQVAKAVDLSTCRRLLDLGGGPGTYAIEFCRQYDQLNATVFDLPTSEPFFKRTVKGHAMGGRVVFEGGDYLLDDIGGSYDIIWVSHILHAEGPGDCQKLLHKIAAAAAPGARVMIHDFILTATMNAPLFPALFALNMLLGTLYGQSYSEPQIRGFMAEAGIENVERLPFNGPNDSGILMGVRP